MDSSENCAQILDWLGIQIPRHFDSQAPYKVNTLSESDPNYWQAEWKTQVYNYKMVRNYPTLYTQDAWDAAQSAGTVMMGLHPESLTDANKQQILAARDAIADLADHQLKPFSDGINGEVIYLWGDDMPVTTPASDLQFPLVNYEGEAVYDNADFQPFLIPYLLDDPSSAKGTILVTSGGTGSPRRLPSQKARSDTTQVGTMACTPPRGTLHTERIMNTATPAAMDQTAPVALALLQYMPSTTGQRNTASSPPKAKRLIHTRRSGGLKEAQNTSTPAARVQQKLMRPIFFADMPEVSFFRR